MGPRRVRARAGAADVVWGAGQPFAGAIADRFGAVWVLATGTVLYASASLMMTYSTTPVAFQLTAGVLLGLGISGSSFTIVIGAFGS